ncbi:MAG: flavodoxin family protein [Coriobacteriia bacterium]|nr:flavodoxin family protein [Coriobacteriia bacterium]
MSKVIVFTCSPHKTGTTATVLAEVVNGAKAKGAEIIEYNMNAAGINGCQACNSCSAEDAECQCVQNDTLKPMYKDLREADALVFGSPIYMGNLNAQAWLLLNRLRPTSGPNFTPRIPGKRFVTVITHANADANSYKPVEDTLKAQFERRGWVPVGNLIWAGAGGELPEDLKSQAFDAGQRLVD